MIITSISLPIDFANLWRQKRKSIMRFAVRYLRLTMRTGIQRGIARRYNRQGIDFKIVTVRFSEAEYDTLHYVAATLRVSVSSLIYGLIKLWRKPVRQRRPNEYVTNYLLNSPAWNREGGIINEILLFLKKLSSINREHGKAKPPSMLPPISPI